MKKRLKKWTFEKFWAHFEVLYYKQSSEFMIPAFHDYSLDPKITKCWDLLYIARVIRTWPARTSCWAAAMSGAYILILDRRARDPPSRKHIARNLPSHVCIWPQLGGRFFSMDAVFDMERKPVTRGSKSFCRYSCNNITTTLIQISRLFYFGFFSKTNHQMMI